jgi:hypothetical protein
VKTKFIRVAERAAEAAQAALNIGVHEKAGFLAYHAFASSGSALGTHVGLKRDEFSLNRFGIPKSADF